MMNWAKKYEEQITIDHNSHVTKNTVIFRIFSACFFSWQCQNEIGFTDHRMLQASAEIYMTSVNAFLFRGVKSMLTNQFPLKTQ